MRLFLMRHGHAHPPNPLEEDFNRALTQQGKVEVQKAAEFLSDYQIDKIITSYAKRTIQTSSIIERKISVDNVEIVEELYKSSEDDIVNLAKSQSKENSHILIIGHNPSIFGAACSLIDENSLKYDVLVSSMMPTARIIVIDFTKLDNWKSLFHNTGKIENIFTPAL